jgi:hypothetical protein
MHSSLGSPSMSDASFVSNSRKPCFSCTMHANMRLLGLADPELKDEELEGSTTRGQEHAGTRSNASKGVLCVFVSLHRQACLRVTWPTLTRRPRGSPVQRRMAHGRTVARDMTGAGSTPRTRWLPPSRLHFTPAWLVYEPFPITVTLTRSSRLVF